MFSLAYPIYLYTLFSLSPLDIYFTTCTHLNFLSLILYQSSNKLKTYQHYFYNFITKCLPAKFLKWTCLSFLIERSISNFGDIRLRIWSSPVASGGMVEWLTCQTSNLRIASRMGSNRVREKPLFPWARNCTLIAQYWLVPGMDSRVFL